MPKFTSQAQRAAFHAAAQGKGCLGISKAVAKPAVAEDAGGKLPKRAPRRAKKPRRHKTILES